ncbi:MAG: hypothetical protein AAF242_21005, partial [Bacteroidota bacterium]
MIINFENDPDLSNTLTYPGGCYKVFGLVYNDNDNSLADLINNYNGTNFGSFKSLLVDGAVCGALSGNCKSVTVLGCGAEAGAVNDNTTISAYEGSPPLNLSLSPDYTGTSDPGVNYNYTYAIVSGSNLQIIGFQDDPDLSTGSFTPGEYLVYGISYLNTGSITTATLNTDFAAKSLGVLNDSLGNKAICVDLSSNRKLIQILECQEVISTISPDTMFRDTFGMSSLDVEHEPDFSFLNNNFSGEVTTTSGYSRYIPVVDGLGNCDTLDFGGGPVDGQFDTIRFVPSVTAPYFINFVAGVFQVLSVYEGTFDPSDICGANFIKSEVIQTTPGSVSFEFPLQVNLTEGVTYTVVIHSVNAFVPNNLGPYSYTISNPGQIRQVNTLDDEYAYTYVVVNEETGAIVQFTDDPDLSNGTEFPIGFFTVYGISFEKSFNTVASLATTYIGSTLAV